jgi:hypothetical protein
LVPGSGLFVYEGRTNFLLNSTAPVTQTTASLGTGTYTLWVNGSGTATSSAGTATGSGFGTASNGTPNVFVLSGNGTVTITVSGSLNAFQLELNPGTVSCPTPLIITGGTTAACAADVVTLTNPPPFGSAYTLYASGVPAAPNSYTNAQEILDASADYNDRSFIQRRTNENYQAIVAVSGSNVVNIASGTWAQNGLGKIALSIAPNSQLFVANGASIGSATYATIPTPHTVNIGVAVNVAAFFNGTIQRIAIDPTHAWSSGQLVSVTSGTGP